MIADRLRVAGAEWRLGIAEVLEELGSVWYPGGFLGLTEVRRRAGGRAGFRLRLWWAEAERRAEPSRAEDLGVGSGSVTPVQHLQCSAVQYSVWLGGEQLTGMSCVGST